MGKITLLNSSGDAKVDAVICGAIGVLERVFPGRIGGYYLVGSYVDGTSIPSSDLDIVPIFKGSMTKEEEAAYWDLMTDLNLISSMHLGFGLRNEEQSFTQGGIGIKIGSILLYGEDVRDKIPLWPLDQYLQYSISGRLSTMLHLRNRAPQLSFRLTYPDPLGEFYGYTEQDDEAETSALFGHMMVMASTLVTLKAGMYNAARAAAICFTNSTSTTAGIAFWKRSTKNAKRRGIIASQRRVKTGKRCEGCANRRWRSRIIF